jgi:hypothetical protein
LLVPIYLHPTVPAKPVADCSMAAFLAEARAFVD